VRRRYGVWPEKWYCAPSTFYELWKNVERKILRKIPRKLRRAVEKIAVEKIAVEKIAVERRAVERRAEHAESPGCGKVQGIDIVDPESFSHLPHS
jgi:hypothetical protein